MSKTVLVTGCSSGFGRDIAKVFAAEGWNVAATMRTPEAESELRASDRMSVLRLDVQDRASIDAAVASTLARFGSIDAVVNNAGFGLFGVFEETTREKILEQFEVNVFGMMDVTRAVLPTLRKQRSGVVINVSSGAGVFTLPMISAYCASKFALEGFSEALSYELLPLGIRVKIVEPGGVTSTRFGERSAKEAGERTPMADYVPFVEGAAQVFAELRQARGRATSEEVARVIFEAATDGTDRLRYLATKDIAPLVEARRQTSEEAYIEMMRSRFAPKL
ncbi:SDR family oxidoreductase [Polyangium jinanense]|uniref:SDR family oxidoreductase n=1 Tax=Polyangium jinanense TaxID=2829994 RepID=A0A9X4ASX8_9BACT|nr:SDR family oxidoreductase [Polyangium jinanense]MDC3955304.1 SDR family oxidoreductase [Polyangium jinanense]MDC3981605.1 SDR family oxidoreductase [Polyangium jinanense]